MNSKSVIAPVTVPAPNKTFNYDEVFAAMCMWEEIASPTLAGEPWNDMREAVGSVELRSMIMLFGGACDRAWDRAQELYEIAYRNWETRRQEHEVQGKPFFDDAPEEPGGFDYEFVPTWMRTAVDWTGEEPRVKGSGGA